MNIKIAIALAALMFAACARENTAEQAKEPAPETSAAEAPLTHEALIDRYFEIYKAKDVEAMLALYDEDILGVLYPTTLFGRGIAAAEPGIRGDFEARPKAYVEMARRYRIARDKWLAFGESINTREDGGEERAPLWILFDLNGAGDRIEATYTQIGWAGMIEGPSVERPTGAMTAEFEMVFNGLRSDDLAGVRAAFAENAAAYAYPPSDLENFGPVITGASDVASVLLFKWGDGAWGGDIFVSPYMQFVFVASPKQGEGALDRVALFTFDADPDSPSFEKIIRVDLMGPSGG